MTLLKVGVWRWCAVELNISCLLQAYNEGINYWLTSFGGARPVEFVKMHYWPPEWEMEDTLATVELPGFLASIEQVDAVHAVCSRFETSSQGGALEKQVISALQRDVPLQALASIFEPLSKMPPISSPILKHLHINSLRLPKEVSCLRPQCHLASPSLSQGLSTG